MSTAKSFLYQNYKYSYKRRYFDKQVIIAIKRYIFNSLILAAKRTFRVLNPLTCIQPQSRIHSPAAILTHTSHFNLHLSLLD